MSRSTIQLDSRARRLHIVALCALAVVLAVLLWNRDVPAPVGLADDETPDGAGSRATVSTPVVEQPFGVPSEPDPVSVPLAERGVSRPQANPPPPDYDSEEFAHVPDWMPRPVNALTARAIDASLRSDGHVEGTLHFGFGADPPAAMRAITSHLEAAGMSPAPGGSVFSSEDPPRRCEIQVESSPDGGALVSLIYQGIDHEKGCTCPTCGGHHENPEP